MRPARLDVGGQKGMIYHTGGTKLADCSGSEWYVWQKRLWCHMWTQKKKIIIKPLKDSHGKNM